MKEILKMGLAQFGKLILINVMCFFIVISISVLVTAAFTENIGYKAFGTTSDSSESVELYEYFYKDGEDTKRTEYEEQGYTIIESKIRSKISATGDTVFLITTQLFCWIILTIFIYPNLWHRGTKDSNLVHFKHQQAQPLKGLKCGLISIIPVTLVFLFITFTKSGISAKLPVALLRFFNPVNYSFSDLICGDALTLGELSVLRLILLMLINLFVPAVSFAAYYLGFKNISLSEKFIYKKDKAK